MYPDLRTVREGERDAGQRSRSHSGHADPTADAASPLRTPLRHGPTPGVWIGGEFIMAGWPPQACAHLRLPCAAFAWPTRIPASFAFLIRALPPSIKSGHPLITVKLRTATQTKACEPSATASAVPLGRPPMQKKISRATTHLMPRAFSIALPRCAFHADLKRMPILYVPA